MSAIQKMIDAGKRYNSEPHGQIANGVFLEKAARDALNDVEELVDLCREHLRYDMGRTIEYPERKREREDRIRELLGEK